MHRSFAILVLTAACAVGSDEPVAASSVCDEAAAHLAACSESLAIEVDSCGEEDARVARELMSLPCAMLVDPGKADLWDGLRCTKLGKKMGMCLRVARDAEVLSTLGDAAHGVLDRRALSALVWNVYKGKNDRWDADMLELAVTVDVALVQEFSGDAESHQTFDALDGFGWFFANSFFDDGDGGVGTGVATGGLLEPLTVSFHRSPNVEPVSFTPKMSLSTTYDLSFSEDDLLVVNVHAINFRGITPFERQLEQLSDRLASHQGPILIGGDFNTWRPARTEHLEATMNAHGLSHVELDGDDRLLKLDHVYVRGMHVRDAQLLTEYESSDHAPIRLELELTP